MGRSDESEVQMPDSGAYRVYLGAYTTGDDVAGIGMAEADGGGALRATGRVAAVADPSFLVLAPDGGTVYAVSERQEGRVVALSVRPDGTLRELNSQPTGGSEPCHLSVHPCGRYLLAANYRSGSIAVHPIGEGGALRAATHVVQHSGSGPNPHRQEGPHVHQVLADPAGRVLAVDLGSDSVHVYDFDTDTGHLSDDRAIALRPGSGPRHLAFHPDGERGYLLNELASSITEFDYDARTGELTPLRTLSTLPPDYARANLAAEVVVDPRGRYVFASNRGHDSIAVFDAEAADGELRLVDIRPAGVSGPRHIALSPDGSTLLVAGQRSNDVLALTADDLAPLGDPVPAPSPTCVLPVA
ncbi:lactonase family protein [Saccharopolyspora griseoalba]|uniref:Lactonase family protein n=1 Tax=Saccharopolyspora griseoalba TaxID=1431848 RepID=A0ABW2LSN9_9PSEU